MIAIKDVEMPKNCAECRVRHECKVSDEWDEFDWYYDGRLDGCPLVEIEERKVGKWILIDEESNTWQCSHCRELGKDDWWQLNSGTPEDNKMNYCPHCGAKMDKE